MIQRIRFFIQNTAFVILMYGGRFGIHLGHAVPCFSCPYVGGCSGHCYLMALQNSHFGLQITFSKIFSTWGLRILSTFALFLILFIPFSKLWCGWLCPFCTLQEWMTLLRRKMGIREIILKNGTREKLKYVKYVLLFLLMFIPLAISNFGFHPDFALPFCQICPAKPILPLFVGDTSNFFLDFTNLVTLSFSILSMTIAGGMVVGMFFKERFFCLFCPLLALMHILKKIGVVRLHKNVNACLACGNCKRMCPMDIKEVYSENTKSDVFQEECLLCAKCVDSCPGNRVLSIKYMFFNLFSSSRKHFIGKRGKKLSNEKM